MLIIFTHSVAILRALFCAVCNVRHCVSLWNLKCCLTCCIKKLHFVQKKNWILNQCATPFSSFVLVLLFIHQLCYWFYFCHALCCHTLFDKQEFYNFWEWQNRSESEEPKRKSIAIAYSELKPFRSDSVTCLIVWLIMFNYKYSYVCSYRVVYISWF